MDLTIYVSDIIELSIENCKKKKKKKKIVNAQSNSSLTLFVIFSLFGEMNYTRD